MLRTLTLVAVMLLAGLASAPASHAGSYWWNGVPEAGRNGFSWSTDGHYWNPWAGPNSRCESRGATIPAGSICSLIWAVPANLDAGPGWIAGQYRHANPNFEQRHTVECNGETIVNGTSTLADYRRQWPDMCGWVGIAIRAEQATSVSAASQWFNATGFAIHLTDPHQPSLNILDGHQGWKGTAGACVRYGFADVGSGIAATALVRMVDGAHHDNPSFDNASIVTGTFQTDRTVCVPPPGSGSFGYQVRAADKSGANVSSSFQIAFDVTGPDVAVPHVNGAAIDDGHELRGSAGGYRPTFAFEAADAHSGVAGTQLLLDGAVVARGTRWTPGSDLPRGSHAITARSTDAVGNVTSVSRRIVVIDDVAPTLTIAQPGSSGGGEPVLDVTASDDHAGVAPESFTVTVNGTPLAATATANRLQMDLGRLVDGVHEIVVQVEDRDGNAQVARLAYEADGDAAVPQLTTEECPQLTCVRGIDAPAHDTRIDEGSELELAAVLSRSGRPVAGTVRLLRGERVLASGEAGERGVVRLRTIVDASGPLTLQPPAGSGLAPMEVRFTFVPDTTPPRLDVASPEARGGREPVLDATAADPQTGIDVASWSIRVNGVAVVARGDGERLQAPLGPLASGAHEVVVAVRDGAGNQTTRTIRYEADGGDGTPPLPEGMLSGIFVYERPTSVVEGETHRVKAVVVVDGRPAEGRAELRRGSETLAGGDIARSSGVVDLALRIDAAGPLILHGPAGSQLDPVAIRYDFHAKPAADPDCSAGGTGCPSGGTGTGGGGSGSSGAGTGTGTGTGSAGPDAGTGAPPGADGPASAHGSGGYPRDTVYYVTIDGKQVPFFNGLPLAESGAKLDRVAPRWRLMLIQHRRGTVRRMRRIAFRLWTTEMSVMTFQPSGSVRRTTISPRRQARTVFVTLAPGSKLERRIRRARAGSFVTVRLRVTATDKNENRSVPRWRTFRVRV